MTSVTSFFCFFLYIKIFKKTKKKTLKYWLLTNNNGTKVSLLESKLYFEPVGVFSRNSLILSYVYLLLSNPQYMKTVKHYYFQRH